MDHYALLAILLASPLVIVGLHAYLARTMLTASRQAVACYASIAGCAPVVLLLWVFVFRFGSFWDASAAVYAFIVYAGIAYFYFHLFNTSETARRIRLIYNIYKAGTLTVREIPHFYDVHDVVELRLQRLVETKQLHLKDGYYTMGNKTLYWAAVIVAVWQRILGMPSAEAERDVSSGGGRA